MTSSSLICAPGDESLTCGFVNFVLCGYVVFTESCPGFFTRSSQMTSRFFVHVAICKPFSVRFNFQYATISVYVHSDFTSLRSFTEIQHVSTIYKIWRNGLPSVLEAIFCVFCHATSNNQTKRSVSFFNFSSLRVKERNSCEFSPLEYSSFPPEMILN